MILPLHPGLTHYCQAKEREGTDKAPGPGEPAVLPWSGDPRRIAFDAWRDLTLGADYPEDDGPMTAVKLPRGNSTLTWRSAATSVAPLPYVLVTPSRRTA
ncbi:hypothetical protein GCM10023075_16290 [Streptosporangium album]